MAACCWWGRCSGCALSCSNSTPTAAAKAGSSRPGRAVCGRLNPEIVKRSDRRKFVVLPKRWIVERTIARLNRCRRLAKDWECLNRTGLAFPRWASVRPMLRRLCRKTA